MAETTAFHEQNTGMFPEKTCQPKASDESARGEEFLHFVATDQSPNGYGRSCGPMYRSRGSSARLPPRRRGESGNGDDLMRVQRRGMRN